MAIKNSLGQIIGVIQLINKFNNLVCIQRDWANNVVYFVALILIIFIIAHRILPKMMKIL